MQSLQSVLATEHRRVLRRSYRIPFLMYGMLLVCLGLIMYLFGVLLVLPRYLLGLNAVLLPFNEWIVWYSGMPIMAGFALALADLLLIFKMNRSHIRARVNAIGNV